MSNRKTNTTRIKYQSKKSRQKGSSQFKQEIDIDIENMKNWKKTRFFKRNKI